MVSALDQGVGSRLFERLSASNGLDCHVPENQLADAVESIKQHLADLLNTRPGDSAGAPELGLIDFNDATIGLFDLEVNIKQAIQNCIERYEPRVQDVEVEIMSRQESGLQLRFQIHATLVLGKSLTYTTIDLLLNNKRYQCVS